MEHLTVLSPEAVPFHIEGIAACLRPSTVELTLPQHSHAPRRHPFPVQVTIVCIRALCRGRIGGCKRTDIIYDITYDIILCIINSYDIIYDIIYQGIYMISYTRGMISYMISQTMISYMIS